MRSDLLFVNFFYCAVERKLAIFLMCKKSKVIMFFMFFLVENLSKNAGLRIFLFYASCICECNTEFSSLLKNRTVSAGEFESILDAMH